MNYLSWTALFSDFLKKRAKNYHNEILLDISENDVVNLMRQCQKLVDENEKTNKNRITRGDHPISLEQYGWQDFRRSLIQNNINGLDDNTFFNTISTKKNEWTDSNNNLSVLPYMVLFMLALKEQEVDNDNDFYQRAINYFSNDKQILVQNNNPNRRNKFGSSFRKVFDADFWRKYDEYWVNNGYQSNVSVDVHEGDYVGHFQAQCLISSKQRTRFVDIFESARITKDSDVYNEPSDSEEIAMLMQNYGSLLYSGNAAKFNRQFAKYRQRFVKEFIWQYNEWDGVYRSVELVGDDEEKIERIDGFSAPLLLFSKNNQLCFVTKYEDRFKILRGHYSLEGDSERKIEFIDHKTPISFDGIANYVNNGRKCVFTHENEDGKKYRLIFMPRNIYYFVQQGYSTNYTTAAGLQIGRKYKVVKKHEDEDWNYSQAATIQHSCFSGFDERWEHYIIESLPSIEAERQIIVSLKEQQNIIVGNKVFLKFPIRIKIDNINTSKNGDKAYVVFDNHFESPFDLVFDETEFIWKLNDNEHCLWKYVGQKFKVYVYNGQEGGRIPYPNVICDEYELSKFELPKQYHESTRNGFGLFASEGQYRGLTLPDNNCVYQQLTIKDERHGEGLVNQGKYLENDYLLYLLNENVQCDKRKFISIYQSVYENNWKDDYLINYDRLGFINYDYHDGHHIISLNAPRFILLSDYYHVNDSGINRYSQKDYYEMLLTGGRSLSLIKNLKNQAESCGCFVVFGEDNPPYPQKIIVRTKKASNLLNIARKVNVDIDFDSRKGLIKKYGASLIQNLPSLSDYKDTLLSRDLKDARTVNLIRSSQNLMHKDKPLFVCLDYSSCKKKDSYSMELDLVTYGEYANKKSYLLYKSKIFDVDKYWGNMFVMSYSNPRIQSMRFDDTNSTLRINRFIKIPTIYSRVLTLMTGELPAIEGNEEVYNIPDRSLVVTPNAKNPWLRGNPGILEKLGQD